jgi:flagellar protein FlgJ
VSDPIRGLGSAVPLAGSAAAKPGEDAKLRKVARQMEGVFVQELYKAMRTTVPQNDGAVDGGAGEEMFTGLMDEHLATETPQAWGRGLGEAIYQHLRGQLAAASGSPTPATGAAKAAEPGALGAPAPLPLQDSTLPPLPLREALRPTPLISSLDAGR